MNTTTVQQIEHAIEKLSAAELEELYSWLAEYQPQPIDARLEADLQAGFLDKAILRAADDAKNGRTEPL